MKYYVKTRNWHCKKWLLPILSVFGSRGDSYDDGDGKFGFRTNSLLAGLAVLGYWMIFRYWSGGWTYIKKENGHNGIGVSGKVFYL